MSWPRGAIAGALAAVVVAACGDSTDPGPPEIDGDWRALSVNDEALPVPVRCGLGGCTYLAEMQLRFRSRGRLLDLRRFFDEFDGAPPGEPYDYGEAFPYQVIGRDSFHVIRPFVDTAYADTGWFAGDTLVLNVRKLDQQFGGIGSGRGAEVRYLRREEAMP